MQHAAREKHMHTKHVPGACDVRTATLCAYFVRTTVMEGQSIGNVLVTLLLVRV